MNYAVTMTAWRRPQCVERALRALKNTGITSNTPVFISVDSYDAESSKSIRNSIRNVTGGMTEIHVRVNDPPYGLWEPANNAYRTYQWAFDEGAQAIIAVEDDCVLSTDARRMAEWFLHPFSGLGGIDLPERYLFLCLGNDRKYDDVLGKELDVIETPKIESPWAWCFTREAWEKIKPWWHCKKLEPFGWDWSLTAAMAVNGWKALCPVLARAKNIGRESGANGGGAWWDEHLRDSAFSDGTFGTDYKLVTVPDLEWHKPWMDSEIETLRAHKEALVAANV